MRPPANMTDIYLHEKWAGHSLSEKVSWIREQITEKSGSGAVFTDLGEIAWILNLRSAEIPYNPFFKSILIVMDCKRGGTLFLPHGHPSMNDEIIKTHLAQQKIEIQSYPAIFPQDLLCQSSQLNYQIHSQLKDPKEWDGVGMYRAVRTEK